MKDIKNWIATVIIDSYNLTEKTDRFDELSKIVNMILTKNESNGIILFPAGWINSGDEKPEKLYNRIENDIKQILKNKSENIIVCLGIDGQLAEYYAKDQIALAVDKNGIIAIGRKFYPAPHEVNNINLAKDYLSKENEKDRRFSFNKKNYFLSVCYDTFGIHHKSLKNPNVDIILDLIHCFYPRQSESNFARHGLAGLSQQWKCPVFASTVFFKTIPQNWPSGVYWDKGKTTSPLCTYDSISIKPYRVLNLRISEGEVLIRFYLE